MQKFLSDDKILFDNEYLEKPFKSYFSLMIKYEIDKKL